MKEVIKDIKLVRSGKSSVYSFPDNFDVSKIADVYVNNKPIGFDGFYFVPGNFGISIFSSNVLDKNENVIIKIKEFINDDGTS